MSWLDSLLGNVGRGAEDIFSLGGTELARKFGGQGAKNVLNPLATGLGANFATGAAGGAGIMGGEGLGLLGGGAAGAAGAGGAGGAGAGGASAMAPYMAASTPGMGTAGSSLGGGMGSALNLAPAYGSATGAAGMGGAPVAAPAASGGISQALQMMRGMPGGGAPQQAAQPTREQALAKIYQMFPALKPNLPNSSLGGGFGG